MYQRIVHSFAISVALGVVSAAAQAQASSSERDPAAAEALFRAALQAREQGDWGVACTKFNASMKLDPAASTLINIAKCHEHEGKLATAWADLNQALVLNRETAGAQRKEDLEKYGKDLIAALEPRLPKLKIIVHQKPTGLEITRNRMDVSAVVGDALPVDPGAHEIEATAPGYRTEKRTVNVVAKQTVTVELSLVKDVTSPRRVGAYIAGGVGVAGLMIGGVTGGLAMSNKGVMDENNCGSANGSNIPCNATGLAAAHRAQSMGLASTIGFAVGGAGVVTAAILLFAEPKRASDRSRAIQSGMLSVGRDETIFGIWGAW